jgi:hypothetical protein
MPKSRKPKFGLQSFKMTPQLRGVIRTVKMKNKPAVNTLILFCDHWWRNWGRPGRLARTPVDMSEGAVHSCWCPPTYQIQVNQLRIRRASVSRASALALSTVLRTTSLSYGNMRFSGYPPPENLFDQSL